MAKSINTFLKSKMNQDLDSRLIPSGEYRTAKNIQVSASEGANAGAVENILGNVNVLDIENLTGVNDLHCIGYCVNDETSNVYLFWTNFIDTLNTIYSPSAENYIIRYNSQTETSSILVQGNFLNFSRNNPIYGSNVLENLLFWTDNRNQPRVINLQQAEVNNNYYTTEDQISVAKYNPYNCIDLYDESYLSSNDNNYESTMKDVVSKSYPNGGYGNVNAPVVAGATTVQVNSFVGDIVEPGGEYPTAATIGYTTFDTGELVIISSATLSTAVYDPATSVWTFTIVGGVFPDLTVLSDIILNPNRYYSPKFAGDPDFLEDKFSRFSYRFKFEDNEYSLMAPFTQAAFIPEQDGYFLYVKKDNLNNIENQSDTYRSTVVSFMKNKVNDIKLRIPLPFKNYNIQDSLKLKEIDILYKESDAVSVKVIDNVVMSDIEGSAGTVTVDGAIPAPGSTTITVDNLEGGVPVGGIVSGFGITGKPVVVSFTPTDPNNPSTGGDIEVDIAQTLVDNVVLNINDPNYFVFNYQSKKPFKTLPEAELIRVYDKVPVKALAQEVSGNRVIYGNFQNQHTPPKFLNYNVSVSAKADFDLKTEEANIIGGPYNGTTITIRKGATPPNVGDFITLVVGTGDIPAETQVISVTDIGGGDFDIELTNAVTNLIAANIVLFQPGSDTSKTTSIIEYPNHSVKSNRNYQVGIVLSDRYGRSSSVILSNNKDTITINGIPFSGSTIYSPYIDESIVPSQWPGNSIKLLLNQSISSTFDSQIGTPGIYNGNASSSDYNPLGWYSYKVVVKQTEQEYYNVYLPGIMASYPSDPTLELGTTSHVVLINDNINKVPRDLSEVGPEQRQFRSSVKLFGRVENTNNLIDPTTDLGSSNKQYYPERFNDIVSTISTARDLFDYTPVGDDAPRPDYFPQFYDLESNPLIARISTHAKIGQISTTNYDTVSAQVAVASTTDIILLASVAGDPATINPGDKVLGSGFPDDLVIETPGYTAEQLVLTTTTSAASISTKLDVASIGTPAPVITVGDLIIDPASTTSIPAGTVITAIDVTTPSTPFLTLNNVVNISNGVTVEISNPARIKVNKPVSVALEQTITIVNDATPGLQYLAVYETEPVESLLDIFWESSTSGLISDINNAVIDGESGGASLSGLNPSPFTEALPNGGEIFAAPFSILDNFGQIVPNAEIDETLEIISVFDNAGQLVNNYFSLIQISSSNLFNVKTTSTYFNTIFFNYVPDTRIFNFTFRAVVNGLETIFEEQVALQNISPTITTPTNGQTFSATAATELITTIEAENGSANTTTPLNTFFNPVDCTIVSQRQGSLSGPEVDFFILQPAFFQAAAWRLVNNAVNTLPVDTYYLTLQVQDAGGGSFADEVDIIINMGVTVENVYQKIILTRDISLPEDSPCYLDNWWSTAVPSVAYQFITYFEVTSGPTESQGSYIYNGPFSSASFHYFYSYFGGVPNSPIGYSTTWTPVGDGGVVGALVNNLVDENNVIQIDFANKNTGIEQLKFGGTEVAAFDEWFNGGVAGSQPCRYSQVWPFPSGFPYNASTDGTPAECDFNPLGSPAYCVPGMTEKVSPYAVVPTPGADGTILSAPGGVLDISANAEQFGLDQYTWAVVT
jgi:hypothetical protein